MAQRRLGAEVPELHQKFPLLLGVWCPKLKSDPPKKVALDPPPPLKDIRLFSFNYNPLLALD